MASETRYRLEHLVIDAMYCDSAIEKRIREQRQEAEARLAVWKGIAARKENISPDDNPYTFTRGDIHSHATLLWCRWLVGWLREDERQKAQ